MLLVPRYVRVNTLLSSVGDVCRKLSENGWKNVTSNKKSTYADFIGRISALNEKEFMLDYHLNYLLVFPPGAQFHDDPLLIHGNILLQDKVSNEKTNLIFLKQ